MMNIAVNQTVTEPAREIKVVRDVDVVVVGGGPGGVASAMSAARNGARVVLIERYGHLGGMATGGLVNAIPNLCDWNGKQGIAGICQEMIDRLEARGGVQFPEKKYWGTTDKKTVDFYLNANYGFFYIRKDQNGHQRVIYTCLVDPEMLKNEFNNMVTEAGVDLFLHSWGTRPIMEGNCVKGVFFESKSGRLAILGKVVIDSTGDGDIFAEAGAQYEKDINPSLRIANLAMGCWITNVDIAKRDAFSASYPREYQELMSRAFKRRTSAAMNAFMTGVVGSAFKDVFFRDILPNHDGVVTFQPHFPCKDQTDVEEMTHTDVTIRKTLFETWEYFKKNVPGYEKSWIMLTAPQLGTTGGKRVIGEYIFTEEDVLADRILEDTIAVLPNNDMGPVSAQHPNVYIPYRTLVPRDIDGLLVACRGFSSSDVVNNLWNLIPHCLCFGQAAGTAAAMAVKAGIEPRKVDYLSLHNNLVKQGVILPDIK